LLAVIHADYASEAAPFAGFDPSHLHLLEA
jgi:hypothetical protein